MAGRDLVHSDAGEVEPVLHRAAKGRSVDGVHKVSPGASADDLRISVGLQEHCGSFIHADPSHRRLSWWWRRLSLLLIQAGHKHQQTTQAVPFGKMRVC